MELKEFDGDLYRFDPASGKAWVLARERPRAGYFWQSIAESDPEQGAEDVQQEGEEHAWKGE